MSDFDSLHDIYIVQQIADIIINHFSGPGRSVGLVCVCVCVCRIITFELNNA